MNRKAEESRATGRLVIRLLVVAVAMFGFGVFAMPPLYQTFCEITGIGQAGIKIETPTRRSRPPWIARSKSALTPLPTLP